MTEFKQNWDLQMALDVMQSETVSGELWGEAVKWLLFHGPPEIQELIRQASSTATRHYFPELAAKGFTNSGEICYDVKDLAKALAIDEEEAAAKLQKLEAEHGLRQLFEAAETQKIQ